MASLDIVLPNLFVPGAAKSATSSLHDYLDQHPDIFMSRVKEPHFFSSEAHYRKGLNAYSSLFIDGKNRIYRGESSTGYMVFPGAIERIRRDIPDPVFVFILRNPVDRAWSHYRWLQGLGFEEGNFRDAFLQNMNAEPDANRSIGIGYKFYYQFGLYAKWLSRYLDAFDRAKIHIVTAEALGRNPLATVNSCISFLGLSRLEHLEPIIKNKSVKLKYGGFYRFVFAALSVPAGVGGWLGLRGFPSDRVKRNLNSGKRRFLALLRDSLASGYSDSPLPAELRSWVASHYAADIASLREITGMEFDEWKGEFPLRVHAHSG